MESIVGECLTTGITDDDGVKLQALDQMSREHHDTALVFKIVVGEKLNIRDKLLKGVVGLLTVPREFLDDGNGFAAFLTKFGYLVGDMLITALDLPHLWRFTVT